jgi:hypothetical protein
MIRTMTTAQIEAAYPLSLRPHPRITDRPPFSVRFGHTPISRWTRKTPTPGRLWQLVELHAHAAPPTHNP